MNELEGADAALRARLYDAAHNMVRGILTGPIQTAAFEAELAEVAARAIRL